MLDKLKERFCPIPEGCRRRGDIIGKNKLKEIKTIDLANELTLFFDRKILRGYIKYNNYSSVIQDENLNVEFENEQTTTSTNIIDNERTYEIQSIYETLVSSVQEENSNLDENFHSNNLIQSSEKTVLNISRGYASHSFCFMCKIKIGSKPMTVLSVEAIIDIYMKRDILITKENRSKLQAIAIYLFWLKTGLDQNTIANIFDIEYRKNVSNICAQVRNAMLKDFVPQYLGAKRFVRDQWLGQNTEMVNSLFDLTDDRFAVIADGTYCYCQKSSNNMVQRKLYSGHKKRPLVKPFVITASNGKIIDVYGNYAAVENDALIMESVMEKDLDLRKLLKKGDLAIFDRVFKDCISRLKSFYGLNCKISTFLKDGQKQMTSSEANQTPLVTKSSLVFNSQNSFTKIDDYKLDGFPKFDVEMIRKKITFGYYQIEQAYGYLSEHFDSNEDYEMLVSNNLASDENAKIIFCKMQSRHSNQVKYKIFISYVPNSSNIDDIGLVCNCKTGKRKLGCCSHVASVIYFMCYGRYNLPKIPKPGLKLRIF
ncbi:unnamed protein product [Brachionus calyciflorus]|uniref:DDE Tnp4 domain-containing protein n=1 Tax=Brachionus calyciflorus TaxID=104777 RepID=A0A814KIR7_9BILA|nr:unnamed protein product [Brachionus calyciflorus]